MSLKNLVAAIDQSIKDATSGDPILNPDACYARATNLVHGAALVNGITSEEFVFWTNHIQESRRQHKKLAEPVKQIDEAEPQ